MVTSTLVDTSHRVCASWRGQLAVLAAGTMLLGLTLAGGGDAAGLQLRILLGSVELLLLIAASARMALNAEAGYDGDPESVALDIVRYLPRLLAQVGLIIAVPAAVLWLALQAASMASVLGLVTVPLAFAVFVFALGPALLAIAAVVQHDRDWIPRSTFVALRGRHLRVVALVLGGGVAAACAILPLALIGFVINAVAGMLGFVGIGLVAVGAVPLLGCGALAAWRALDGSVADVAESEPAAREAVDIAAAFGAAPAPVTTWLDGPSWDVAVEPGAAWGTWIRIEAASVMGFRVTWHVGDAPQVAFASEAGTWTQAGPLIASGDVLQASLPAGSTYVQLTSRASVAQALTIGLLVPPAVAA